MQSNQLGLVASARYNGGHCLAASHHRPNSDVECRLQKRKIA